LQGYVAFWQIYQKWQRRFQIPSATPFFPTGRTFLHHQKGIMSQCSQFSPPGSRRQFNAPRPAENFSGGRRWCMTEKTFNQALTASENLV
jgi:hypothetical protein